MTNLYQQLLEKLEANDKTLADIVWIGSDDGLLVIPISNLKDVFDVDYDNSYGAQEIASDLVVVGDGWWLERFEYDGAEWWDYKSTPILQSEPKVSNRVLVHGVGWETLQEINEG